MQHNLHVTDLVCWKLEQDQTLPPIHGSVLLHPSILLSTNVVVICGASADKKLMQVKLMEKHLHKGSRRLLQFNQEHSKYTQQRVESLEERSENHNHDLPELVDLITRGLMGPVIDQTKLKTELSKTLHGLVRDVMAASHEPGATSTQGTQLNNKMLRKWSTPKGSKVQLTSLNSLKEKEER
jgi:hypothetical protein